MNSMSESIYAWSKEDQSCNHLQVLTRESWGCFPEERWLWGCWTTSFRSAVFGGGVNLPTLMYRSADRSSFHLSEEAIGLHETLSHADILVSFSILHSLAPSLMGTKHKMSQLALVWKHHYHQSRNNKCLRWCGKARIHMHHLRECGIVQ